ncbi:MAG: 3-hydroxyacyl-CoA dehydrogenase NAD-binding domain-containing protein [Marinovum sp.]|nr:3-hydroxyacyl-CoA dehydrogenase NAD-binding domain-containing protein [Marinovum sp.]
MAAVNVERNRDLAWVTVDYPPVNATATAVRLGLMQAVAEVQGARLAILRCAGRTFIAGGDMTEFDHAPEEPHLPDVVASIEESTTPWLALLHGTVLGGGWELAMGCAWRVAAPGTKFGLPEVNVGLIPGAGGTQRAPRLIGFDAAVDMACRGKILDADEMLVLGGIDAIADDLDAVPSGWDHPRPRAISQRNVQIKAPESLRTELAKKAKGQQSPLHCLDSLKWATLPFAEGQPKERALHLDLRASAESKALRHVFFAERSTLKPDVIKGFQGPEIAQVAVMGGGLMGTGIAMTSLLAGLRVDLIEASADGAQRAEDRLAKLIDGAEARGKIRDRAEVESRIEVRQELTAPPDLVIEAIFEDLDAKRALFADIAAKVPATTLLATNTSYLDPSEIFEGVPHLERCLGLHFFAPAHVMKLLEVVRGPHTSAETLARAFGFAKRLRKIPVLSGICDGFIGNRMLARYRTAAEGLLAQGNTPAEIDAAMKSFGYAMGPFAAQDMSGLQIAYANRRRQCAAPTISDRFVEMGREGQRAGKGWYRYENGRTPLPDPETSDIIAGFARDHGIAANPLPQGAIAQALISELAAEGDVILAEGIAQSTAAIDLVQIHGFGFPRWCGGPMHFSGR